MFKRKKRALGDETKAGLLFISPWIFSFFAFSLYPIIMSAYYSFTDFSAIKKPKWVGLQNYQVLFGDALFFKSLFNTLFFVFISIPLSLSLALIIALLLNLKIKGRVLYRSIFFLPSVLPQVASTMIWIWILNPMTGYLNRFLRLFGIKTINWLGDPAYTRWSVILIALWGIGTMVVIFLAAIQDIPNDLYEAADIDGAGRIRKFISIVIPSISHVLLYQIILGVINGFQYFTQVYVVITAQAGHLVQGASGGPKDTLMMYPLYLFYNAFSFLKMGRASAMAWILFLIVGLLTWVLQKTSKSWVELQ